MNPERPFRTLEMLFSAKGASVCPLVPQHNERRDVVTLVKLSANFDCGEGEKGKGSVSRYCYLCRRVIEDPGISAA